MGEAGGRLFSLTEALAFIQDARKAVHRGACPPGEFQCAACVPSVSAARGLDILLAADGKPRAVHPVRLILHDQRCRSGCEGTHRDEHARRQDAVVRELRRFACSWLAGHLETCGEGDHGAGPAV